MTLSFPVAPMKATLGTMPASDDGWAYEIKWDGYRTLAFVDGDRVRLQSSNLIDVTHKYPELHELPGAVAAERAILDAELVVLDDLGRPRFELIQRHERQAALFVFDVLSIDGHDTIALPYEDRRRLVGDVLERGENWMVPAHRIGDGQALLEATEAQELEGIMAKRLGSTYKPGARTKEWRKVKHRRRTEVVIGGYTPGAGNRTGVVRGPARRALARPARAARCRSPAASAAASPTAGSTSCGPASPTCAPTSARSTRSRRRRTARARRGCGPSCRRSSRSPSSRTRASCARPPSSTSRLATSSPAVGVRAAQRRRWRT